MKIIKHILRFFIKILFPGSCPICDEVQEQMITGDGIPRICPDCERRLVRVSTLR